MRRSDKDRQAAEYLKYHAADLAADEVYLHSEEVREHLGVTHRGSTV